MSEIQRGSVKAGQRKGINLGKRRESVKIPSAITQPQPTLSTGEKWGGAGMKERVYNRGKMQLREREREREREGK